MNRTERTPMKRATMLAAVLTVTAVTVTVPTMTAAADSGYPAAGEGYTNGGDWGDVATTAREANDGLNDWCSDQSFWCASFWGGVGLAATALTAGANS